MDSKDPLDSIPFADEESDIIVTPALPTGTATLACLDSAFFKDCGDSMTLSQKQDELPSPADDAEPVVSDVEKIETFSETIEKHNEEFRKPEELPGPAGDAELVVGEVRKSGSCLETVENHPEKSMIGLGIEAQKLTDGDFEVNQTAHGRTNLREKLDEKNAEVGKEKLCDEPGNEDASNDEPENKNVSNDSSEDINGDTDQTTDNLMDSNTEDVIKLMSEKEGTGDDGMRMEGIAAEGRNPSDDQVNEPVTTAAETTPAQREAELDHQDNGVSVSQEHQTAAIGETTQTGIESGNEDQTETMDPQGETHGGKSQAGIADDPVNDSCGTTSTSETITNGIDDLSSEGMLRIDESVDSTDGASRSGLDKESSPEIIIGSVDSAENVTLKDATSEKVLLGNGSHEGSPSPRDSSSSRTSEDKRKSSSDMDIDFALLEMESSHLNINMSKQKTSLRKRGSLARRKKPSRGHVASDSSDTMFQDSTDGKPMTSPTSDITEDEVFDKLAKAAESQLTKAPTSAESYTIRKAAQPFKPSLIMPGLQDLSKSKLFSQERKASHECPTSPVKSPLSSSFLSPTHRPIPPLVLPKPASKIQKDSQNKSIAAENAVQSSDYKSVDGNNITCNVEEALAISNSTSSSEGPKPGRSDSGPITGPRFARTDSWSSVSSPRTSSRRESTSSLEGGEGGSAHSTPRRASIQGCAYTPMGFRPRRSSSIVLDSNNKLVDFPVPSSPTFVVEKDSEALIPSEIKSPTYTQPAWLSEMKTKTGVTSDSAARLRSVSIESNESIAVSASSGRSRNSSGSVDGVQGQNIIEESIQKRQDDQEPQRPSWMKPASQSASPGADKLSSQKGVEENGDDDEDKRPVPPWAAELKKKKNRPYMSPKISETSRDSNNKMSTAPYKGSNREEDTPVVNSKRTDYGPSWIKTSQETKKPPPPAVPSKPTLASKPPAKPATQNLMKQYETPQWKLELAEKKKRREAEMMPAIESGQKASSTPEWQQQLGQRNKQPNPDVVKDEEAEDGGSGPNWAKRAEERRARLMKSGLFDQAKEAEES